MSCHDAKNHRCRSENHCRASGNQSRARKEAVTVKQARRRKQETNTVD